MKQSRAYLFLKKIFQILLFVFFLFCIQACLKEVKRSMSQEEIPDSGRGISKVAVLQLKNLSNMPNRVSYEKALRREICVRLLLKGYDVLVPGRNRTVFKEKRDAS